MSVKMWYYNPYQEVRVSARFLSTVEWNPGEPWPLLLRTPLRVSYLEIRNQSGEVDRLWAHPKCPPYVRDAITSIQEDRGGFEGLVLNYWQDWLIDILLEIFSEVEPTRALRESVLQQAAQPAQKPPTVAEPPPFQGPWSVGNATAELDQDGDLRVRTPERSGFRYVIRDTFPVLLAALTDLIAEEPVETEEGLAKLWAEAEPKPEPREDRYLVVTLEHSTILDAPGREELADWQQNVLNRLAGEGWRLVTVALPLMYLERTDAPTKD